VTSCENQLLLQRGFANRYQTHASHGAGEKKTHELTIPLMRCSFASYTEFLKNNYLPVYEFIGASPNEGRKGGKDCDLIHAQISTKLMCHLYFWQLLTKLFLA